MTATTTASTNLSSLPTPDGRFGVFGRRFVPETLMAALDELTEEYAKAKARVLGD